MKRVLVLTLVVGQMLIARAEAALHLSDVLRSVRDHYPLLDAALAEQAIAEARVLSRHGAFDLQIEGVGKAKPAGFYQTYEGGISLEQPTSLWGAEFFGGYRIGSGEFALWDGGDETNGGGEFEVGVRLPLLRDRAIDKRRAGLRLAQIDAQGTSPLVRGRVLSSSRAAALAYWKWVAAGKRVRIAEQLFAVAKGRQDNLRRRVDRGALPEIDLADNERLIVDRRVRLIAARRDFERAALDLSLFLRTAKGQPRVASLKELPDQFPEEDPPVPARVESDIERAFRLQPKLQQIDYRMKAADLNLSFVKNQLLPKLNLKVAGSQDFGNAVKDPDDKGRRVLLAAVEFGLPVQRREARGKVAAAEAKLRQIRAQRQFARERIAADVRKAMAALSAAFEQLEASRRNRELADKVRGAEERKLSLGISNLINLNIRELQAFDAASNLIAAQADYFRALANYRVAVGELPA